MGRLLEKIRSIDRDAAKVFEEAGLCLDRQIQSLTREDLNELLPGRKEFKLRREIYKKIHEEIPTEKLLEDLKEFIPQELLRDALSSNGVLVDYLLMLKEMKQQMDRVQEFFHAHIKFLDSMAPETNLPSPRGSSTRSSYEEIGEWTGDAPSQKPQGADPLGLGSQEGIFSELGWSIIQRVKVTLGSLLNPGMDCHGDFTRKDVIPKQREYKDTVKYKVVVSGTTFGAEEQLMNKVMSDTDVDWIQCPAGGTDHKVIVLFCPVASRIGADVESAMSDIKDDKPIILVLMHHTRESKYTAAVRTWSKNAQMVLDVSVFFHDTVKGLISCAENDSAATAIRNKLLEYKTKGSPNTMGETLHRSSLSDSGCRAPENQNDQFCSLPKPQMEGLSTFSESRVQEGACRYPGMDQHKVKFKVVVSGRTFGAEHQLMKKVLSDQDLVQCPGNSTDHKVTVLFCTITSRPEADVASAMSDINDGKPVILVMMHHSKSYSPPAISITWPVVRVVKVAFHESAKGLISCTGNTRAAKDIQMKLQEYKTEGSQNTNGKSWSSMKLPFW